MARSPQAAIDWARSIRSFAVGMCANFWARAYGLTATGYRDAVTQWYATPARYRHPGDTTPPLGALCFWAGGSHKHGHVAGAYGIRDMIRSTDWANGRYSPGPVGDTTIGELTRAWGMTYLGWTSPFFAGQLVTELTDAPGAPPPPPPMPSVSLGLLQRAASIDAPARGNPRTYGDGTPIVEHALQAEGLLSPQYVDGSFGTSTITAYAAWQRRLGYAGRDANGIPGMTSLAALGARHGFHAVR